MSNELALPTKGIMSLVSETHLLAVEAALATNDLSKLSTPARVAYYNAVCESVGLNPLTQPFAYITLEGKLTLYARKECSEQLRAINKISTQIISRNRVGDMYEVHARASDKNGRTEEDFAVVPLTDKYGKELTGNNLANAQMKCVTKAKRRVTLAISGLGLLDESEIETIRNVTPADNPQIPNPLHSGAPEMPDDTIPEDAQSHPTDSAEIEIGLGDFVCNIGKKHIGRKLSEFQVKELEEYLAWMKSNSEQRNQPLTGDWLEFYSKGNEYLASLEFGEMSDSQVS